MSKKKTKVAILMGGPSYEHEVSLRTGRNIIVNLDDKKYEPFPVVIDKAGKWEIPLEELKDEIDIAFIAMHGSYGEDGKIQDDLEKQNIPYTGSDIHTSALGMNKFLSLRLLEDLGFTVPNSLHISRSEWKNPNREDLEKIILTMASPWVVKPNRGGSSLDMYFTRTEQELGDALSKIFELYKDAIVQEYIPGKEVTCGVLDHGFHGSSYALVPTEIVPRDTHYFDHESKYNDQGAERITPARLSDAWLKRIRHIAKDVHDALGCRGMSRVDMIITKDDNVYVLEVNTIPGLTKTCVLPEGAKHLNMSLSDVLDRVIQSSLKKI